MAKNKGFTKIEVLIVVILCFIVIGIDIFVISYLNSKQQDIQVIAEVSQIRSGLEVFLLTNNYYPQAPEPVALNDAYSSTEKLCLEGFKKLTETCQKNILNPVPNYYLSQGNTYLYKSTDNNKNYQLEFFLKTNFKNQGLAKGKSCATNSQITNQPCF